MRHGSPLPPLLAALARLRFDPAGPDAPAGDDGIDLTWLGGFVAAAEATAWLRSFTGNERITADCLRLFATDRDKGMTALWLRDPAAPVETQPVVYLGGEGELAVVARDVPDFAWRLAWGAGPREVARFPDAPGQVHAAAWALAEASAGPRRTQPEVAAAARALAPWFDATIGGMCH